MYQLKTRQVCLFFLAFVPVSKIFILPSIIAGITNNDMWLSSVLSGGIDLITIVCLLYACAKYKSDFFTIIEKSFGTVVSRTIFTIYAVLFFFKALLPVNDLKNYVEITLYETIPTSIYFFPFFVLCFFFCCKPLRVIGRISDIMWIMTLIGIVLIFALSVSNVNLSNVLPVGVNGIAKIFSASYHSTLWYGDGVYLIFFIGNFAYKKRDGLKIASSFIGSTLIVVIFSLFFYSIFTTIASRQTYSLPEISKYSTVINNIGRFDYIGIALILFSNLFSTSLPLFFATLCLQKVFSTQKKWHISLFVNLILLCVLTVFREYFYSIEKFLLSYGNAVFIGAFNVMPILFSVLPLKESYREVIKT